jgi:hypothetical protein
MRMTEACVCDPAVCVTHTTMCERVLSISLPFGAVYERHVGNFTHFTRSPYNSKFT